MNKESSSSKAKSGTRDKQRFLSVPLWAYLSLSAACVISALLGFFFDLNPLINVFYGVLGSLVVSFIIDLGNTRANNATIARTEKQADLAFKHNCSSIPYILWEITGHPTGEEATVEKMARRILFNLEGNYNSFEETLSSFVYYCSSLKRSLYDYLSLCFVDAEKRETSEYQNLRKIERALNVLLSHYESHKRYADTFLVLKTIGSSSVATESAQPSVDKASDKPDYTALLTNAYMSCEHMNLAFNRAVSIIVELYPDLRESFEKEFKFL